MPQGQVKEQRRFDFLWLLRQVPSITEVSYLDGFVHRVRVRIPEPQASQED